MNKASSKNGTAKILEVFALNYKVLIEAFIHVRVVTPLLLNFNAVALITQAFDSINQLQNP